MIAQMKLIISGRGSQRGRSVPGVGGGRGGGAVHAGWSFTSSAVREIKMFFS